MLRILVIDPNDRISSALIDRGQLPINALQKPADTNDLIRKTRSAQYDVFIVNFSDQHGNEILITQWLRKNFEKTPILALARTGNITGRITLMNAGADICLEKPVHFDELIARIKSLVRRNSRMDDFDIHINDWIIKYPSIQIWHKGRLVEQLSDNETRNLVNQVGSLIKDRIWPPEGHKRQN